MCGGVGRDKITVANGNHALPGRSHRVGVTSDEADNAPRLRVGYGEDSKESKPPLTRRVTTHTASIQDNSTPVPWRWRSRGARIRGSDRPKQVLWCSCFGVADLSRLRRLACALRAMWPTRTSKTSLGASVGATDAGRRVALEQAVDVTCACRSGRFSSWLRGDEKTGPFFEPRLRGRSLYL